MANVGPAHVGLHNKTLVFLLFFVAEALAFAIVPLAGFMTGGPLRIMQAILVAILLGVTLWLRRSESGKPYWPVCYAFFVGGMAVLVSTVFSGGLMALLGAGDPPTDPQGAGVAAFSQGFLRVVTILVLMAIVRTEWRSMYLQKGRIGLGLAVGIPGFLVLAAWGLLPIGVNKLLALLPWILLYILSNAFGEELMFRGIFLKQYEAFLGKWPALLLTAITFTLLHFQAGYVVNAILFLVQLFPFALVWGWLMQKTDSIWGSVLFHAGADCIIIFSIYRSLGAA
jgi:membrane protease YdiL (CAAX protease family)